MFLSQLKKAKKKKSIRLHTYESNQGAPPHTTHAPKSSWIASVGSSFDFMIDVLWQQPPFYDDLNIIIGPLSWNDVPEMKNGYADIAH